MRNNSAYIHINTVPYSRSHSPKQPSKKALEAGIMSQLRQRNEKKSVSFTVQASESQDEVNHVLVKVPGNYKSPLVLPVHLLLIINYMFKQGLTASPFETMVHGAILLGFIQVCYCSHLLIVSTEAPKKRDIKGSIVMGIFGLVFSLFVASPLMFVALILFGAPLYDYLRATFILGIHLSFLIVYPIVVCFQFDFDKIYGMALSPALFERIFTNPILCGSFFSVIGTWLGVIPIPLDWDRPWQQWPITLLSGAYGGYALGFGIGFVGQYR